MVLIRVDFPRPVWPVHNKEGTVSRGPEKTIWIAGERVAGCIHTNAHHIELETALQQLPLNLRSDTVEADMAARKDGRGGNRRGSSRGHREESWNSGSGRSGCKRRIS